MSTRSRWEVVGREGDIVFIRDLNFGGRSVTNDAETVFLDCQQLYGPCQGLVWDQLTKV
jgi:hypothetical protein